MPPRRSHLLAALVTAAAAALGAACTSDADRERAVADAPASDEHDGSAAAADTDGSGVADADDVAPLDDSAGSGDVAEVDDSDGSAADDADAADDVTTVDADTADAPDPLPPFVRDLAPATGWPAPDGRQWVRSIVHLHSTHSHDACDDNPRPDGAYNLPCLASLRAALCAARIDYAYLTDHPTHMVEVPFEDLLLHDPATDTLERDDEGRAYANHMRCADGFVVTLRAGAEDALMPLGMHGHVEGDVAERDRVMNEYTPEAAATMRALGAHVWVAHTELRGADDLRRIGVDGIEVYQLHANIDPRLRENALGLEPFAPVAALAPFLRGTATTPPDLAVLAFLEPNQPSLRMWATLLADGPVVGTVGTDAHENVFPSLASDGERLDSYRRMMSWFSNYILADAPGGARPRPAAVHEALAAGRVVIGFDILGSIAGFDAALVDGDGRHEVGATVPWAAGKSITVQVPALRGPSGIEAAVACSVLRAEAGDWTEVAAFGVGRAEVPIDAPGAYRVACEVTGEHLRPYLTSMPGAADRTYPWIYTNAFRVVE